MKHFVSTCQALAALVVSASAQSPKNTPFLAVDGTKTEGYFGFSVEPAGDWDGDGIGDLIAGIPGITYLSYSSSKLGRAQVLSGADFAVLIEFAGAASQAGFGWDVGSAGDWNADGRPDVFVLAVNGTSVFSGADGALLHEIPAAFPEAPNAAAGGGDVNGDGFDDLVIGYPYVEVAAASGFGVVRVHSGSDGQLLYQVDHTQVPISGIKRTGWSVAMLADVNGDGFDDFAVGSPGGCDSALSVFSGADGTNLYHVVETQCVTLGHSLAAVGDLDGDGAGDFAAGALNDVLPNGVYVGGARVYSGADGQQLFAVQGQAANEQLGRSVNGGHDVDGDGVSDVIVGSAGEARVHSGSSGALVHTYKYTQSISMGGLEFGYAVALAPDLNGDGLADPVVGHPGYDLPPKSNFGRVTAYLGSCGSFETHCTAGTSATGCSPALATSGAPSASATDGFDLVVSGVDGASWGTVLFGTGGRPTPFGSDRSILCLERPFAHTRRQPTSGTAGACDGSFAIDLNELWNVKQPGLGPEAGAPIAVQALFRDRASGLPILSEALAATACP